MTVPFQRLSLRRLLGAAGVPLLVVIALFAVIGPASAQSGADSDDIQVLTTEVADDGTVELVVAVPGRFGEIVAIEANFALSEDGTTRPVDVVALDDDVDVWLVIDTSGSMRGAPLEAAKGAALSFLDQLPPEAGVGVIGFGASPTRAAELTTSRDDAAQAISALNAAGETAMYDALVESAQDVVPAEGRATYVVVLSDGGDTASVATLERAVSELTRTEIGLYAISLQTSESDAQALRQIVESTGGQLASTDDLDALSVVYTEIAERLASRYLVRYASVGPGDHRVVLSVASNGAVATVTTQVDVGGELPVLPVPRRLDGSEPIALREVILPAPGLLGGRLPLLVGAATMFGALSILLVGVLAPSARARLDGPRGTVSEATGRLEGAADRLVARSDSSGQLDRALDAAGLSLRPGEFVMMSGLGVVVASLAFSLVFPALVAALLMLAVVVGIWAVVRFKTSRRRSRFADQLTDGLSIITGSLRAGRGLPQALELVATEASSPMREEFQRVVSETRVGRDMNDSIADVANRMKSADLHWVNRAMAINRQLGGDLVEVLDNVADTIRDRRRIARQVQSLSAEGRATGWVLLALPVLMFIYLRAANPEYAGLLTSTAAGITMLSLGLIAWVIGGIWIRRLVNIRY